MNLMAVLFLCQIFSCWFMTGSIWLVQILVYPNFARVGTNEFHRFHLFHLSRITWVVAPVMVIELLSAVGLLFTRSNAFYIFNLVTILLIWILTFFINVPSHDRLSKNWEMASRIRLAQLNWPRTFLWSLRSIFWAAIILSMNLIGELP